ncbi:hypothetical protein PCE1_002449 [Barthelona sp. PCE]
MEIHKSRVNFPIMASVWLTDNIFIVAGGGGSGDHGVPNHCVMYAFDNETNEVRECFTLDLKDKASYCIDFDSDSSKLFIGVGDSVVVYRFDAENECLEEETIHNATCLVKAVKYCNRADQLFYGDVKGNVYCDGTRKMNFQDAISGLEYNSAQNLLAIATRGCAAAVVSLGKLDSPFRFKLKECPQGKFKDIRLYYDVFIFGVSIMDRDVSGGYFFLKIDTQTHRVLTNFHRVYTKNVGHSSFTVVEDSNLMVSANSANSLTAFDLRTKNAFKAIENIHSIVTSVAVSPESKTVLTTGWDNTFNLFALKQVTKKGRERNIIMIFILLVVLIAVMAKQLNK